MLWLNLFTNFRMLSLNNFKSYFVVNNCWNCIKDYTVYFLKEKMKLVCLKKWNWSLIMIRSTICYKLVFSICSSTNYQMDMNMRYNTIKVKKYHIISLCFSNGSTPLSNTFIKMCENPFLHLYSKLEKFNRWHEVQWMTNRARLQYLSCSAELMRMTVLKKKRLFFVSSFPILRRCQIRIKWRIFIFKLVTITP